MPRNCGEFVEQNCKKEDELQVAILVSSYESRSLSCEIARFAREIRHLKREIDSYTAVTGKKKAPRPGRQTTNQPIIGVGSRYHDSPVQPRFFLAHYC